MKPLKILDGGMGRELMRIGAPFRQPEWSALALMEGPDWVRTAHRNFIDAGADVVTTNSYAVVPFHIGDDRFRSDGERLATLSGTLAREAASASSRSVEVAGSLPPLFGSYEPDRFDAELAPALIDPLVRGLAPSIDLWLAETLGSTAEVAVVSNALRRHGVIDRPLWVSYTLVGSTAGTPTLASGESIADGVVAGVELGAQAVLFNCCSHELVTAALGVALDLLSTAESVQVGGYANRFAHDGDDAGPANEGLSGYRNDLDPTTYADVVARWRSMGATIVGGCCGITPEHIAAIQR